ncbi:hypothetical protein HGA92_01585 [Candidatus Gracilibacteria bacterium]|nr:hypothetical protein [Candidatus Gracilibacteria bacterium]NUJ98698.1 hypothetical protein [Candidatus Gracilibacteria bacterium]
MSTKKKIQVSNIFFNDEKGFQQKITLFKKGKKEDVFVISDFDRTITKNFVNEEEVPSIISILRKGNFLGVEYTKKSLNLFNTYHPIEKDIEIIEKEKKEKMLEWRENHFKILQEYGLQRSMIEELVKDKRLQIREGVKEFFSFLASQEIPLIIFSASGLGVDSLRFFLQEKNIEFSNISLVSNDFCWNEEGLLIEYKKPIIHTCNKEIKILREGFSTVYDKIEKKKNILLLGDSLGDVCMAEGFPYENIIKIGFLNKEDDKYLSAYKEIYDVVITGDGDFSFILDLGKEIFGK